MNLTLTRRISSEIATTGELYVGSQRFYTIEQPWRDNAPGRSCVALGTYDLIPYQSPAHGPTWCLHNPLLNIYGQQPVPEGARSVIELHAANWATQLEGCIALGLEGQPMIDPSTGEIAPAVENSRDAIAELLQLLGPLSAGHTLTIATYGLET